MKNRVIYFFTTIVFAVCSQDAAAMSEDAEPRYNSRLLPNMIQEWTADAGENAMARFGLPILSGAVAIRADIDELEEPPPDPQWPEPMEEGALYFGETDWGRFIPESLTLNDGVRPDVVVITQNALTDCKYMECVRARYARKCWLPGEEDVEKVVSAYVQKAVESGEPEAYGISIVDERPRITGLLGVMLINELLAQSVFQQNIGDRSIYYEGSCGMFLKDHLSPNGMVMKFKASKTDEFSSELIAADSDFRDWHTRRLLDDPDFTKRRDERWRMAANGGIDVEHRVACRAFSKLRTSIAGLYAAKGYGHEAAAAFREGYALDPQATEVHYYVRDVLIPQRKFDVARELLKYQMRMSQDDGAIERYQRHLDEIERCAR